MSCPTAAELVEERINRVLTQYRESPNLLHVLRTYLGKVSETALQVCDLPEKFDLDTAVGDQLTILGKRLGWPRCHCVCDQQPAFGFDCDTVLSFRPVTGFGGNLATLPFGFCEGTGGFCETFPVNWDGCPTPDLSQASEAAGWANCNSGLSEVCLEDDDLYRKFLKVRVYQVASMYDLSSLEACVKIFFGAQAAILYAGQGRVVVAPGRDLSDAELLLLQLYPRVLPTVLGVSVKFHFGELRVFGFGDGWGGFLEESLPLTYENEGYIRTGKIFGFCDDAGGFCESWEPDGLPLGTEDEDTLADEQGNELYTGPLTEDAAWMCRVGADWMCELDVKPYDC